MLKIQRNLNLAICHLTEEKANLRPNIASMIVEKSPSLTMSAVSSILLSAPPHALREERHFALVDGFALSNLGSLLIVGVRNSVRPSHLFDHQLRS